MAGGGDWSEGPGWELLCVSGPMTSSLCTFLDRLNRDNNSQRVLSPGIGHSMCKGPEVGINCIGGRPVGQHRVSGRTVGGSVG